MTSSLFSSFQENTKCESLFFADTCTRRVPIFYIFHHGGSTERELYGDLRAITD